MIWFDKDRIPPGNWPFLSTACAGLRELEQSLTESVDLTEGHDEILITGCLEAYRTAVLRRVLDLVQAVVGSWNACQLIGSVVCARALLETLATFHSLLSRAQIEADRGDWKALGKLVDGYAFSSSPLSSKGKRAAESPPPVGRMTKKFIRETGLGDERFWTQICEEAHPNGERLMAYGGILRERRFDIRSFASNEHRLFPALYNCLYSCCWLINAMLDFDILCEHIRMGVPPPEDHPLIRQRARLDELVDGLTVNLS